MELICGGHPTWFVAHRRTRVCISPLLRPDVGPWQVYPPRRIRADRLELAAIVVADGIPHMDVPSLLEFPARVPVHVGPLTDAASVHQLERAGREVRRLAWGEPLALEDLEVRLLAGIGPLSTLRQLVLVRSIPEQESALIAWDAHPAPEHEAELDRGDLRLIAVCDQATLTPPRLFGTPRDRDEMEGAASAAVGWRASLDSIAPLLRQASSRTVVVVSGGSLMRRHEELAPLPGCREQLLAEALAALAPEASCHLAAVGDSIAAGSPAPCAREPGVDGSPDELAEHRRNQAEFLAAPRAVRVRPTRTARATPAALRRVEHALGRLELPLLMSSVGQAAVSASGPGLDSRRIAVSLAEEPGAERHEWTLDLNTARFAPAGDDGAARAPYGLEMFLGDFLALADGELPVDALVGGGMRAWYPDHPASSLVQFMLHHHGRMAVGTLWL